MSEVDRGSLPSASHCIDVATALAYYETVCSLRVRTSLNRKVQNVVPWATSGSGRLRTMASRKNKGNDVDRSQLYPFDVVTQRCSRRCTLRSHEQGALTRVR